MLGPGLAQVNPTFDPGSAGAPSRTSAAANPDCSSANGVVPDHWVENPVHTACATCPMNVFGAKKNNKGKDIRPCSDHKRLIVAQVGNIDGDVAAVQVPVMSLKNLHH